MTALRPWIIQPFKLNTHMQNTDLRFYEREAAGTLLTKEVLINEGFRYKLHELTAKEIEDHPDPYYYYKGDFRLYEVIDDFYYRATEIVGTGVRVQSVEAMMELYIRHMGRAYTKMPVLEDTPPPDYQIQTESLGDNVGVITLIGGPADGKKVVYPKAASFFLYQVERREGQRKVVDGYTYQKRENTTDLYDYKGPTY